MKRRIGANRQLWAESLESRQLLHGGAMVGAGDPPTAVEQVESALERFDENDDAILTQDEVSERLWNRLSQADADENGAVSADELTAHLEARAEERAEARAEERAEGGPVEGSPENGQTGRCDSNGGGREGQFLDRGVLTEEQVDGFFTNYDASEDGLITPDEVSEHLWESLSEADLNDDGVSSDEFWTFQEARRQEHFDALFNRLDANHGGGVSEDEVSERRWTGISEADVDNDGSVTSQELQDYFEARREHDAEEEASGEDEGESEMVEGGEAIAVSEANGHAGRVVRSHRSRGRR